MARPPYTQVTLQATKDRITQVAAEQLEDRLQFIGNYAVTVSPVDTGAYVESFSLVPAGSGGGRMKKSDVRTASVREGTAAREDFASRAKENLYSDIAKMNLQQMLEDGNARVTLRNRSPHAIDVEYGEDWSRDGYKVFAKVRRKFG